MDYTVLAEELFEKMQTLTKAKRLNDYRDNVEGTAFILHYIDHKGGNIIPSEISHIMGVSSARVAAALNDLESKELITREIDTSDRRRIIIKLTPRGKSVAEEQNVKFLQKMAEMLALLGEEDAKEYVRITGKLAELMGGNLKCSD